MLRMTKKLIDKTKNEQRLLLIDSKSSSFIPIVWKGQYGTKIVQLEPLDFDSNFPKNSEICR